MEPMEAKTETSLTGSRLPGPREEREREYLARWRAELPGSSMSTCLPLPPPDSRPSLSFFLISLSHLLHVSLSSSFFCLSSSRGFVHLLQGGPPRRAARTLLLLLPLSLARAPNQPIRESFHANSPENALVVAARQCASAELVSPSKP